MPLYQLLRTDIPPDAVMLVAMEGWLDAGLAAATAVASLLETVRTERVAYFETDDLIDQRARRPMVQLHDGRNAGLRWPEIQLRAGRDRAGRPLLLLMGPEPDMHWRAFARDVADLANQLAVRLSVAFGAFPAPAPHTRPIRIAAVSPTADLARRIGVVSGAMTVPAGVEALLELSLDGVGIPAVGLWARVPHYVARMPYPGASAALIDTMCAVSGLELDTSGLHAADDVARQRVDEQIAASSEHLSMVRKLESSVDAAEGNPLSPGDLPSGDELASELERYLREQRGDPS